MKMSVSSLSFPNQAFTELRHLPPEIGVEVFFGWGTEEYWRNTVPTVMNGRTGELSVHAPIRNIDLSAECDEKALFDLLCAPFSFYKEFSASSYVVHTNNTLPNDVSFSEILERRARAEKRLLELDSRAKDVGVRMLVENLGWGAAGKTVFDCDSFLELFTKHERLDCIIDVGHAVIEHYDIPKLQKVLGDRIKAYHIHDNDGINDLHLHIGEGIIDFGEFARTAVKYTPNATYVFEYGEADSVGQVVEDTEKLHRLFEDHSRETQPE